MSVVLAARCAMTLDGRSRKAEAGSAIAAAVRFHPQCMPVPGMAAAQRLHAAARDCNAHPTGLTLGFVAANPSAKPRRSHERLQQ